MFLYPRVAAQIREWLRHRGTENAAILRNLYQSIHCNHCSHYIHISYLTGRYIAFRIFTLSFAEYLNFKKEYAKVGDPKDELADYIRFGGFPATHLQKYSDDEVYTIPTRLSITTISFIAINSTSRICRMFALNGVDCKRFLDNYRLK